MAEKLLTLQEVAGYLRVSERSVLRYIYSGRLRAAKIGYWRILRKDLEDFFRKNSSNKKVNT